MSLKGFFKKVVFFIPLIGGWYASKNPSSKHALELVTLIITAQFGRGHTRADIMAMVDAELLKHGFTEELRALARAYAEKYMDEKGFK